jgi:alanine-synthesizing transaminase
MFAARIAGAARNALAVLLDERRAAGRPIRDLTTSNPTLFHGGAPGLLAPLADPAGLVYAPDPRGLARARAAVARAWGADPDDLVLTASTSEAYSFLFKLLCDPGDAVLAPEPSYPLFAHLTALDGVAQVPYPLAYDGAWHIDLAGLGEALGQAPRARAILVVSPNNPTGSYLARDDWRALSRLAAERGLALIVDEVFADYPLAGDPDRVTVAAARSPEALTFSLGGLSKSAALPQLKLAWILAGGPGKREALSRLELVADSYLSVGTPVMLAAEALLAAGVERRRAVLARARQNLDAIARAVEGTAVTLLRPAGGWSAVLRLPATRTDEEVALALLREHDVLVHPGYFFDFPRGTYLVVSLLADPDDLGHGLRAILALPEG